MYTKHQWNCDPWHSFNYVVNLPKEYEFLIQMLNAQEDNGLSFRLLCDDGHSQIMSDLEMHGATKLNPRGKHPIF